MSRKIEALKSAAEKKSQDALQRTDQAITKLVREGKKITFNEVARTARVTVAYLYKHAHIRERIDHLRKQQEGQQKKNQPQPSSDKSKIAIINQLRERIRKLEAELRGLRNQNEMIYGELCQLQPIKQEREILQNNIARLQSENERLRQQLKQSASPECNENIAMDIATPDKRIKHSKVSERIQIALIEVGIELNSTLVHSICSVAEDQVFTAIEALKGAMNMGEVRHPGGWLKQAIEKGWSPNKPMGGEPSSKSSVFDQWFNLARSKGLVIASTQAENGEMYVFDKAGVERPFEQMLEQYPLTELSHDLQS